MAGLPALWSGGFVDPALERDQDPPQAWLDAVDDLDARADGHRVLQVPGAEFGAFRWGYTVDQPIPGLSDTPLVTRDLLPLGSPAAMNLLFALDDRLQQGALDPDAVAPVARLFGANTVWLANDLAYDRFRTPRPDAVADAFDAGARGLAPPRPFGEPSVNAADVPMVDEEWIRRGGEPPALAPVWHLDVDEPVPVVRAKQHEAVLVGDGAGVVDAAAAGLLHPDHLVRYASMLDDHELATVVDDAEIVVVTDTDRPRARHWRSSQDTLGFTEDGTDRPAVLRPADGDARLVYATREGTGHRTVAVQEGPVTARASAYGEPLAYRPEDRAVMALDASTATAWRVADRADAVGEHLELDLGAPTDHVVLRQPDTSPGARRITAVTIAVDDGPGRQVDLDDRSLTDPGQRIDLATIDGGADIVAGSTVLIEIAATDASPDHPDARAAVGFATVDAGLGPTTEVVHVPTVGLDATGADTPLAIVLTRERVRPTDRWRNDPEPVLRRELTLPHDRRLRPAITVRLDRRAGDAVLA
ncbi:MAG: alpha-(1-_3)-arabinofuranosyltransferase family protein, partial [Ilumatobacteraceae bacterium]